MSLQEQLHDLFLLDQQVRGLRQRLDTATRRRDAQQARLNQLQRQHTELADQLRHTQAKASDLESEASTMEQRIAKLREQMNTVKNNKEFSALLVEVNTFKVEMSKMETAALEQLGQVDRQKAELAELTEKVANQQKLLDVADTEVDTCKAQIGEQLDAMVARRDAAADQVPADARVEFDRASRANDGQGMAPVTEESRRHMEYACGGCYMSIPVENVNALIMRADEIIHCPNCGRILYIDHELKASIGAK